jgi:hypothetical protein
MINVWHTVVGRRAACRSRSPESSDCGGRLDGRTSLPPLCRRYATHRPGRLPPSTRRWPRFRTTRWCDSTAGPGRATCLPPRRGRDRYSLDRSGATRRLGRGEATPTPADSPLYVDANGTATLSDTVMRLDGWAEERPHPPQPTPSLVRSAHSVGRPSRALGGRSRLGARHRTGPRRRVYTSHGAVGARAAAPSGAALARGGERVSGANERTRLGRPEALSRARRSSCTVASSHTPATRDE